MGREFKILFVDDDTDDASLFEEILNDTAPSVKFYYAKDGQEALDILKEAIDYPDIIFLDLNMPRMGGKECLDFIKNDELIKSIPVVIYTTSSHAKDIEDALNAGALGFITKPSNINDLKIIIETIIKGIPDNLQHAMKTLVRTSNTFSISWNN